MKNTNEKTIFEKCEEMRAEARRKLEAGELINEEEAFLFGREMVFNHGSLLETKFPRLFRNVPHLDWMAPCGRISDNDRENHEMLAAAFLQVAHGLSGYWSKY